MMEKRNSNVDDIKKFNNNYGNIEIDKSILYICTLKVVLRKIIWVNCMRSTHAI